MTDSRKNSQGSKFEFFLRRFKVGDEPLLSESDNSEIKIHYYQTTELTITTFSLKRLAFAYKKLINPEVSLTEFLHH